MRRRDTGPKGRFAPATVRTGEAGAPYRSTVREDGRIVGETAWGGRVDASIVLAMLHADASEPGTPVEVAGHGRRQPAIVQPDRPLQDAHNERLKA